MTTERDRSLSPRDNARQRVRLIALAAFVVGTLFIVSSCELGDPTPADLLCAGTTTTTGTSSTSVPTTNPGLACTSTDPRGPEALAAKYPAHAYLCNYKDSPGAAVEQSMKLDVYLPDESTDPRRVIVYLHGGGWYKNSEKFIDAHEDATTPSSTSTSSTLPDLDPMNRTGGAIKAQLARGWIVVSADYRLSTEAVFPAQLIDARAAVNCAKNLNGLALTPEHPWIVDTNHVVVSGSSAGGTLATLVAMTAPVTDPFSEPVAGAAGGTSLSGAPSGGRTTVHAAVNLDGPTDLRSLDTTPMPSGPTYPSAVFGSSATFQDMAAKLVCPPDDFHGDTLCPGYNSTTGGPGLAEKASPKFYVDQPLLSGELPPRVYLACGTTPGFPAGFQNCADHRAMHGALNSRFESAPVLLDDTTVNTTSDSTGSLLPNLHGNHLNLDIALNFKELQTFLDS